MSQGVVMRHILGTTRIVIPEFPSISVFRFVSKKNSNSNPPSKHYNKGKELNHTTVILQDRLDIQEVPAIVRKVKNLDISRDTVKIKDIQLSTEQSEFSSSSNEEEEILNGLSRCHTLKSLTDLLDIIPATEFTSFVALHGLRRIVELENNTYYRNISSPNEDPDLKRVKRINKLLNYLFADSQSVNVVECLDILSRDNVGASNASYKRKLINEILIRCGDVKFSVSQMCKIVKLMSGFNCDNRQKYVDELWTGFIDRDKDLDEHNISEVFQVLPLLNDCRKMVYNMLERKFENIWWQISTKSVVDIMKVLEEVQPSLHIFTLLARNSSTNIHSLSEDELLEIVNGFMNNNYVDENIETFLVKYIKAKGQKIKNISLICCILDYCVKCRVRSESILEGCSEHLIKNYSKCSPVHFKSIFIPFGFFNYCPNNSVKFWQVVENFIEEKFIQFKPEDIIDVMLACIYLGKFPLNTTKKVLNPYFLDRMHSCRSGSELQQLRTNLKIFDTAMTLECPFYQGPLLPRDYAVKRILQDGRVKRLVNSIYDIVADLVGTCERVSTTVLLPQLPVNDLYLIDILLHPVGMVPSTLNLTKDRDLYKAILIHTPEHYCSKGKHLLGPQIMKTRHLKRLGITVVGLQFTELINFKENTLDLQNYLIKKLDEMDDVVL